MIAAWVTGVVVMIAPGLQGSSNDSSMGHWSGSNSGMSH